MTNPAIVNGLNTRKNLFDPTTRYDKDDIIFKYPVYVDILGNVSNTTLSQRIENYFNPIELSCDYLIEDVKYGNRFDSKEVFYRNLTDNFYVIAE